MNNQVAAGVAVSHAFRAPCVSGDFSCGNNCTAVQFCTESQELITVQTCPFPERCNTATVACMTNAVCYPPPNEDGFKCHTTGSLPDPFDCQKYHFCYDNSTEVVDLPFHCGTERAYNPLTTLCEYTFTDRVCQEGPIDKCLRPGQAGPQFENPNIYYVCIQEAGGSLMPWLFRCQPNEIYVDGRCNLKPTTTTEEPSTTVIVTTEAPTEEPTTMNFTTTVAPTTVAPTTVETTTALV